MESENNRGIITDSLWKMFKTRMRYYVPIVRWLACYDKKDFINDLLAGITVALLLIPQSLSYASGLAKLQPIYGLYSSFFPTIIYSIFGTSRQLAVGPEALVSLLVGNAIGAITTPDTPVEEHISIAISLCFLVGIITLVLGLARLGFFDSVLSRALLRGFVTAVACVIAIEQMPELFGVKIDQNPRHDDVYESPFLKLIILLQHLGEINWVTTLISVSSVAFLLGFSRLKIYIARNYLIPNHTYSFPLQYSRSDLHRSEAEDHMMYESFPQNRDYRLLDSSQDGEHEYSKIKWQFKLFFYIPDILIVVFFTIIFSYSLNLAGAKGVVILGDSAKQGGFRAPSIPKINNLRLKNLMTPALLISILGFVESTVGAKQYAGKYHYPVSANRELVAFGILNLVGCFFNCLPSFASIARSQVNDAAGAKTQLAGFITGVIMLLTILFILPIFYYLPKAVMASIVLVAALGLLEFEDVHLMWKIKAWTDLALMLMTFLITMLWSVEAGTLISICLSLVLVVKHCTAPKFSILAKVIEKSAESSNSETRTKVKFKPLQEIFQNREEHQMSKDDMEILIVKIEERLFFGNTGQLKDRLRRAEVYGGWIHIHPGEEESRLISTNKIETKGKTPTDADITTWNAVEEHDEAIGSDFSQENVDHPDYKTFGKNLPLLRAVIFDIENMPLIDASAIQVLIEVVKSYHDRCVDVCFVKLREKNKPIFLRSGLLGEIVGSEYFFRKINEAITFLHEKWEFDEIGAGPATSYSTYTVFANFPKSKEGHVYHLDLSIGQCKYPFSGAKNVNAVSNRILVVGDHMRAKRIAEHYFDKVTLDHYQSHRGFNTFNGNFNGKRISIVAIGMGYPMMDIFVRESRQVITENDIYIIRFGSCGILKPDIVVGSLIVSNSSAFVSRDFDDGHYYINAAVKADHNLTSNLYEKLLQNKDVQSKIYLGLNISADTFYSSQGRLDANFDDNNKDLISTVLAKHENAVTFEMETYHLFHLSKIANFNLHVSSVLTAFANRVDDTFIDMSVVPGIEISAAKSILETLISI